MKNANTEEMLQGMLPLLWVLLASATLISAFLPVGDSPWDAILIRHKPSLTSLSVMALCLGFITRLIGLPRLRLRSMVMLTFVGIVSVLAIVALASLGIGWLITGSFLVVAPVSIGIYGALRHAGAAPAEF